MSYSKLNAKRNPENNNINKSKEPKASSSPNPFVSGNAQWSENRNNFVH